MVKLVRGCLEEVFKDNNIREIIETRLKLVKVRRPDAELRKQYIRDLIEAFRKEDWVKAIIICPDHNPECGASREVIINIVPTCEYSYSIVDKLYEVQYKVLERYPREIVSDIDVFLANRMLACYGANKCYIIYEKESDAYGAEGD